MAKKAKKATKAAKKAGGSGPAWVKSLSAKQIKDLNKLKPLFSPKPKCQRLSIVSSGTDRWNVKFEKD